MNQLNSIEQIRSKIDKIDDQLLGLIAKRGDLALEMKKAKANAPVYSPSRETQILRRMQEQNTSKFPAASIRSIYSELIGASRNLERRLRVSYLGPEGTYSHEAAVAMFGSTSEFVSFLTLADALKAAENGNTDIAFLPIENSSEGAVVETHRLLLDTALMISGEYSLPVVHCLLSKEKDLGSIKTVHAHPQAFGQCREWLQIHLPQAQLITETSNSQAALIAATHSHSAAIASKQAGLLANIPVLLRGINDFTDNKTRFVALGSYRSSQSGNDKTTIICSVGDKVGALYELLAIFAKHKINLTRLESHRQPGDVYVFYIDFEGHQAMPTVAQALSELSLEAKTCKILGSYPSGVSE